MIEKDWMKSFKVIWLKIINEKVHNNENKNSYIVLSNCITKIRWK